MFQVIRRTFLIIDLKAMIVVILSVGTTYFCGRFKLTTELPLTLIATAVIFPIVFSIGGAYKRREVALSEYGSIKAHGRVIYFAVRDWRDTPGDEALQKARQLLGDLLLACRDLFMNPIDQMTEKEDAVYKQFSTISRFIREELRQKGLATGEVSRCNQYLSKMIVAFENTKHIYQYRTPRTLKAFSNFFIVLLPILYGPHFAHMGIDSSSGLHYIMPILLSLILVSLDNIQNHLENPFDQIGEDDIQINAEKFVSRLDL